MPKYILIDLYKDKIYGTSNSYASLVGGFTTIGPFESADDTNKKHKYLSMINNLKTLLKNSKNLVNYKIPVSIDSFYIDNTNQDVYVLLERK